MPETRVENVQAADFTPDGSALAIVRYVPSEVMCQLEFPIGKVLHRDRAIDDLRFSPDGKYLAFITHDNAGDDRGTVVILKKTGEKVASSPLYESARGSPGAPPATKYGRLLRWSQATFMRSVCPARLVSRLPFRPPALTGCFLQRSAFGGARRCPARNGGFQQPRGDGARSFLDGLRIPA